MGSDKLDSKNLKGRDALKYVAPEGRIILKCIFQIQHVRFRCVMNYLRTGQNNFTVQSPSEEAGSSSFNKQILHFIKPINALSLS
jgi:hypothetical protein